MPTDFPHLGSAIQDHQRIKGSGMPGMTKGITGRHMSMFLPGHPSRLPDINLGVAVPGQLSQLYSRIRVRARGRVARHYTVSSIPDFSEAGQRVVGADRSGSIGCVFPGRPKRSILHAITAKGAMGIDKIPP